MGQGWLSTGCHVSVMSVVDKRHNIGGEAPYTETTHQVLEGEIHTLALPPRPCRLVVVVHSFMYANIYER